jgi:hypothetical protein
MALGVDLLHHLRVTLDMARHEAIVESANSRSSETGWNKNDNAWQVRLWSFPQACVAEAQVGGQHPARVLIDTGNWQGTYVSSRWARRNQLALADVRHPLLQQVDGRSGTLEDLELGGQSFGDWPVRSALPAELDRLGLFDILMGHDLVGDQRITLDLAAGLLRCESSSEGSQP